MASEYLGEKLVDSLMGTPYEGYTPADWALDCIERFGGIDGSHHKNWVLDQVARILHGTPVLLYVARWEGGKQEYRPRVEGASEEYLAWVASMTDEGYSYDEGSPP